MVPTDQIQIGIQPEAQFQVDSQPLVGTNQEPDGKFIIFNQMNLLSLRSF